MNNNDDILEIKKVTEVEALYQTKAKNMTQELKNIVEGLTPMQRRYAEYRSKGMKQADAAAKAGSTSKDRKALTRTGYNWEQLDGMKEYIAFLYQKRAEAAILDEVEIVEKLREAVERAMRIDRPDWAVKGIECMGNMIGAFDKTPKAVKQANQKDDKGKSSTDAFKHEGEVPDNSQRLKEIHSLMHSIQKSKVYNAPKDGE
jgi:phage shock protein A